MGRHARGVLPWKLPENPRPVAHPRGSAPRHAPLERTAGRLSRLLAILVSALGQPGCVAAGSYTDPPSGGGAAHPPVAMQPSEGQSPRARGTLPDSRYGELVARKHALSLPLPDREAWRVEDEGGWVRAVHRRSFSELRLRAWAAPRSSSRASCMVQVLSWIPSLERLESEAALEQRTLETRDGLAVQVVVHVEPSGEQGYRATLVAYGARPGRCVAAMFTTDDESVSAVLDRAALIETASVRGLRLLKVEDRVGVGRR
jgi:hypothetical protein